VIDLSTVPTQNIKIKAVTTPAVVGSVIFHLDGEQVAVENLKPYRYGGNGKFTVGPHTLTATPYCEAKGQGPKGAAFALHFQVVKSQPVVATQPAPALQVFPNPFSGQTTITFSVSEAGPASLEVYDSQGALVERLYQDQAMPGKNYTFLFKPKERPSGLYFTRLITSKQLQYFKLLFTR
jgi:hypothetical protein